LSKSQTISKKHNTKTPFRREAIAAMISAKWSGATMDSCRAGSFWTKKIGNLYICSQGPDKLNNLHSYSAFDYTRNQSWK